MIGKIEKKRTLAHRTCGCDASVARPTEALCTYRTARYLTTCTCFTFGATDTVAGASHVARRVRPQRPLAGHSAHSPRGLSARAGHRAPVSVRSPRGFPARFSPACPFPVHTTVAHLIAHTTSAWHRRCRLLAAATVVMLSLTLACSITSSSQRGGHLSHLRGRRCILQVVLERVEECSHPLLCCVEHLSTHTHSAIVSPRERGEQGQMHPVRREHACGEASHT